MLEFFQMKSPRAYILSAFILFVLALSCFAFEIIEPADGTTTFNDLLPLQLRFSQIKQISINNVNYGVNRLGEFRADLVLRAGKNLVYIVSEKQAKALRILRKISFPDMDRTYNGKFHWARKQVSHLATLGIIEAYPDGNFYPQSPVSKGEFSTWLAKAKGITYSSIESDVFYDVPKEHWRASYIAAVVSARYMDPISPQLFGVDEKLTRLEAAIAICRAENVQSVSEVKSVFADVPSYLEDAELIFQAYREALIKGVDTRRIRRFEPLRFLTRAEAAVLLYRTSLIRKKMEALLDFTIGYDASVFCKINTAPEVIGAQIEPKLLRRGENNLTLQVKVADKQGKDDVIRVAADFGEFGIYQEFPLSDDGINNGDKNPKDGIYTLRTAINFQNAGTFDIKIIITDSLGQRTEGSLPMGVQ